MDHFARTGLNRPTYSEIFEDGILSQAAAAPRQDIFSQVPLAPDEFFTQASQAPSCSSFLSQIPSAPGDDLATSGTFDGSEFNFTPELGTQKSLNTPLKQHKKNQNFRKPEISASQNFHPVRKRHLFQPPLRNAGLKELKRRKNEFSAQVTDHEELTFGEEMGTKAVQGTSNTFVHNTPAPVSNYSVADHYTPSPLVLSHGTHQGVKLKSVAELPEKFRSAFSFPYFNIVQSKVFDEVFYSDKPVVLCAPTGAGKTVIFELAIIRLIMKLDVSAVQNNFKIVYMAPMKALCRERFMDWQQRFTCYGMKCQELTGDSEIDDYYQLQDVNIIFTTPEKWDSMTRKWRDNKYLVQSVCLFLVDEIHMLNDITRGSTIEAVVSRMKTIQQALSRSNTESLLPHLRFVAVSATIPNIEDVADWLGDEDTPATHFKLDESYRPVMLRKVVLGFPYNENKGSEFRFDLSLSYRLNNIITTYSENKPTLIFCSTRKSSQQAAEIVVKDSNGSYVRSTNQRQLLQTHGNVLKDNKLRDLVVKGVGYHHAGLDLHDRKIIEELFYEGNLSVLVATSTLAMGVNLPAHLVIVKSTVHYNMGVHVAYTDSEILQMIGRAGRPQFDTSATAVIMTKSQDKHKYESLVNGQQLIESSLHKNLIEHLNAEIVLHTINDISIAMEWIRYTFLYIRVMKNPKHYGMPPNCNKEQIERKLQDLCMKSLNQLNSLQLISMDEESIDVKPTEAGRLMARYCIAFETMKKFCCISGTESISDLLTIVATSEEFCEIQLRINEKKTLNMLNSDKNRQTIRYPLSGKIKTKEMKVNCLIQAALGCLTVQDFSLQQETNRIFRVGQRVARCFVEVLWMKDTYRALLNAVLLSKCMKARLWEDSKYVTKQLDGIGPAMSNALVNAGVDSFQKIEERNPRELEMIVNRHPPFGNQLRDSVSHLPKYELTIDQVAKYSDHNADIIIHLSIANSDQIPQNHTKSNYHTCLLIIGDEDNLIVFRRKVMDIHLIKDGGFTKKVEIQRAKSGPDLNIDLISQDWVGLDVQCKYTPIYLGGTKRILNGRREESDQRQQVPQEDAMVLNRPVLDDGREECSHRCVNKAICGHECCKHGVAKKRTPMKSLSKTPLINKSKFMDSYITDLKKKIIPMPDTPRIAATNRSVPPAFSTVDLTKFAYSTSGEKLQLCRGREEAGVKEIPGPDCAVPTNRAVPCNEAYGTPRDRSNGQCPDDNWVKLDLFMRDRDQKVEGQFDADMDYSDHDEYPNEEEESNFWEEDDLGEFELQSNVVPAPQCTLNNGYPSPSYRNSNTSLNHDRKYNLVNDSSPLPSLARRNQRKPQNHTYGKVVAWSNSQELEDGNEDSWSGSDNELLSAEQELSQEQPRNGSKDRSDYIQPTDAHYLDSLNSKKSFQSQYTGTPKFGRSAREPSEFRPESESVSVNKQSKYKFTQGKNTERGSNCKTWVPSNVQELKRSKSDTEEVGQYSFTNALENKLLSSCSVEKGLYKERTPLAKINLQNQLNNLMQKDVKNLNQSNITQYGQIVKKLTSDKTFNHDVHTGHSSTYLTEDQGKVQEKKVSEKFSFSTCFTDNEELGDEKEHYNEVDTFSSIFDGIF